MISFVILILGKITGGDSTIKFFSVYRSSPLDLFFYIRIFGHVLGHSDWLHFYSNILIILLVGPMLEEKYGSKNIIEMIVITALMTGLLNIIFFENGLLGASGVAFMFILLSSFANYKKGKIPLTLILVVMLYMGREIIDGILIPDNVSQLTHIFGGICGGIFGYTIDRQKSTD